jgi:hypothetical protein
MDWTVQGSNAVRRKRFFYSQKRADRLWILDSLLFNWYRRFLPEVKRSGRAVNHSPPSSAEVENEWSCTSAPSICLNGVDRGNCFKVTYLM